MHYQKNNQPINKDDLIMLDGGCLFKQYSSDITRLWPINGIENFNKSFEIFFLFKVDFHLHIDNFMKFY